MLFINKMNLLRSQSKTQVNLENIDEIILQPFVDFYDDTCGWYAIGHYQPTEFLAAIAQKDAYTPFCVAQVQLTWAKFNGKSFVVTDKPLSDSQPITLVEEGE